MLLSPTFFLEEPCDLEHKQYVLLAFLQKIEKMYKENDITLLDEVRYHTKNVECFSNTRGMLEGRGFPELSNKDKKLHEAIRNLPDSHPDYKESLKICKWALKKLQEKSKEGGLIYKRVELSMKMYYIGRELNQNSGYLMLRYLGSTVAEVFKMNYNESRKEVTFKSVGNYSMPGKKDFGDVKVEVLDKEKKADDLFIAVEGQMSFNTKKTTLPVLKGLLITNVFEKRSGTELATWKFGT